MVRTRIAPSPTGYPHIGTIYQVLFDYVYAHQNKGKFILRLEDTDRTRFVEGAEEVINNSLAWFNLLPDESPVLGGDFGPYRQSERLKIYEKYATQLVENGHAYFCFCTRERLTAMREEQEKEHKAPMYDRKCRNLTKAEIEKNIENGLNHTIRMKIPDGRKISFEDLIVGHVEFDSSVIDDQVIIKSDGYPTYHFAVVVDDHLMEITHILRGREWISSTPKHVLLYEYFGWTIPHHAHLPLLLNSDGKGKLSKRHGHSSVDYYKKLGYLPEAVLNYLSNVVWRHPEEKEIYTLDEFIKLFKLTNISSQGARFDLAKLDWVNKEYIKKLTKEELYEKLTAFDSELLKQDKNLILQILPLVNERMTTLLSFESLAGFFFKKVDKYEYEVRTESAQILEDIIKNTKFDHESLENAIKNKALEKNIKVRDLFMDLRIIITGKSVGPPLIESMLILGLNETLERIKHFTQKK